MKIDNVRCLFIGFALNTISLSNLVAQKTFTILYKYIETPELGDSFYFPLLMPITKNVAYDNVDGKSYVLQNIKFSKGKNDTSTTICTFLVDDTSCSTIYDGFGRESIVIPGDTAYIFFSKKKKVDNSYWINRDKNFKSFYFYDFTYAGENKYVYSLFDSLAYYTGMTQLSGFVNFKDAGFELGRFFQLVTRNYEERIQFLEKYCVDHDVQPNIKKLAISEVRSVYISNLLDPLTNVLKEYKASEYPKTYIEVLNKFTNLDDEYKAFRTSLYVAAVYQYITLYKVKLAEGGISGEPLFQKTYYAINELESRSPKTKEYLLSLLLLSNLKQKFNSFSSFLSEFKSIFPESKSCKYLDSLYASEKNKKIVTLEQALNSTILGKNNVKYHVKEVFDKKPILIDSWATWCEPCLFQMKFQREIEHEYAGKVDFIYLSFDKIEDSWIQKSKALNLGDRSFLLNNNFNSDFAYHFNIESIPHYVAFSKGGKPISEKIPRPSNAAAFRKFLDDLINDTK